MKIQIRSLKRLAALAGAVLLLPAAEGPGAAEAAEPMTVREIVEQVAVPLALANDPGVGINTSYSAEELGEIVRALNENGITLRENTNVMQMLISGYGLFEEVVIREICSPFFGEGTGCWTLEEQDWFERQLAEIGMSETYQSRMPGPGNMTFEKAEAFALKAIRKKYGKKLQLEDRSVWKEYCSFTGADRLNPKARWSFSWVPLDTEHGRYTVEFNDKNPSKGMEISAQIPDWTKPYTGEDLLKYFRNTFSWAEEDWPQSVWQKLHEMMQGAELDPGSVYYKECRGILKTAFPDPEADEISREEAIRTAKDALKKDRAALDSAVLTEYGGERSWIVALIICSPMTGTPDQESGIWTAEIDSRTGTVRSIRKTNSEEAFFPEAALEKDPEGTLDFDGAVRTAAEAVREEYPGTDPLDEAEYTVSGSTGKTFRIEFTTRSLRHGDILVLVSADGLVEEMTVDLAPLTGDNLFLRYWKIYGYFGSWEQDLWVRLGKDMADLDPLTVDGLVLKAARYPEESSVKIGHEEAQVLGMKATGKRRPEVNTCVLVDAEPHPVWIMRILTDDEQDPVLGIDAETGETVFREAYTVDETPDYVLYSTPETWKRVLEEI